MSRRILALVVVLLVGAEAAAAVLRVDSTPPWPSQDELREHGFAVWPQDTVEEAMEECDDPQEWQLDPEETALQFARDVLRYPSPNLDSFSPQGTEGRYLINTDGVRGVFLGEVVDVKKYDRCWFVVHAEPRESGYVATVAFLHRSDGTQLVVNPSAQETRVGYGSWEDIVKGDRQVVLDPPELEPDATGHLMTLWDFRGVYNVNASPLGYVPSPATTEPGSIATQELARTTGICRSGDGFRSPRGAISDIYSWTFGKGTPMRRSRWIFRGDNHIEPRGGDRWLFEVDDTNLDALVPNLKEHCWRVTSIKDDRNLLRSLTVAEDSLTFDLRWGKASAASIVLGTTRGGDGWSFQRLEEPTTVSGFFSEPRTEPFYVSVVLREKRQIVSAQLLWYQTQR